MPITACKYINNSDSKKSYVGLFHYNRPSRAKKENDLDIYGLVSVSSEVEIPGQKISKFAWDGIVDGFEYSKVDSTNESLKLALKEGIRRVKQLIKNDEKIGDYGVQVDFTIFISNGIGVYIGAIGDSDIFLYKDGRLVDIEDMLKSKSAKTAAIAMEKNDLLLCSTKDAFKSRMIKLMAAKNAIELKQELEEIGKELKKKEGMAVFLEKTKEKKDPVSKIPPKADEKREEGDSIEPKDTDYVPTTKPQKSKIFKSQKDEKDLRMFFKNIFEKFSNIFQEMKKGFKPIGALIAKAYRKVVSALKAFFSKISEKFGKKKWFKKASAKITQSKIGRKKERKFKAFRIDGYKVKDLRLKRFKILVIVAVGIAVLLFGVKFTIDQKEAREISKNASQVFIEVEELISQAQSKISTDRDSSKVSVYRAEEKLESIDGELGDKDSEKYNQLESEVLGIQDTLFKIERLSKEAGNLQKFYDTFNTEVDSKPSDLGIYRDEHFNEYLLLSDTGLKQVSKLSIYNNEIEAIPDSDGVVSSPQFVYMKDTGVFVFDSTNGILKAKLEDKGFKSFSKLSGLSIKNIGAEDPVEFAVLTVNENAYILDRGKNALLKSTNFGSGYGLSFSYITEEDFSEANDILSDLSVYILVPGENGVRRYVNSISEGKLVESPLTIKGLDRPLENARYGFTADDLNKGLYVFDSEQKRILRFEKPMEGGTDTRHPNELHLLKQYVISEEQGDIWNNVKDLVVDWDEEYLYILDGTTIWRVTL